MSSHHISQKWARRRWVCNVMLLPRATRTPLPSLHPLRARNPFVDKKKMCPPVPPHAYVHPIPPHVHPIHQSINRPRMQATEHSFLKLKNSSRVQKSLISISSAITRGQAIKIRMLLWITLYLFLNKRLSFPQGTNFFCIPMTSRRNTCLLIGTKVYISPARST
ncbi:hypothetical protein K440DRAFT_253087 [Wilcoxina mikolae CBS 423.85]|nr:hypothetical protein K440DRAFT_253087 [Wilcoxina mikolae CBS 423.85]